MVAPVDRPRSVLAGTFGLGILTFLLLPSEVGYQDLAALIARDVATVERTQKSSLASPFGTIHAANLSLPQPLGSGITPSLGYTLASLDPNNAELTNSIRERILRESAALYAPESAGPRVDRSRKGDQLTAGQAKRNDTVAAKGDRLAVPAVQQQAAAVPPADPDQQQPPQQVAALPTIEGAAGVPAPFDIEAEHVVAGEKHIADAVEEAAQMQVAAVPDARETEADEGMTEAKESSPKVEKPTRRAESSKRSQRTARLKREEQRRAERIARDSRQKAEKLARQETAKSARTQQAAKPSRAKIAVTAVVDTKTEAMENSQGNAETATEIRPVQADAQARPADATPAKGFNLASAGDYRVGIDGRPLERVTAPAAATAAVPAESRSLDGDLAQGKSDAVNATVAMVDGVGTPSEQTSKLFFGIDPMGKKVGSIEPWRPGREPRLDGRAVGATSAGVDAPKETGVKLAALPPAEATDRFVSPGMVDQSISKDPSGQGGQTIAPKGEVTGADQRPMTPAERLGLADEKSRAKTVKCLTEVIYFESRGEQVRGQMAVAQVVLNRAFSGKYPTTVCGVVYQNAHRHLACQFTFACDGIADRVKEPDMWDRATVIANEMLDGKIWLPEVGKATHYHAHWVHPGWVREMTKLHRVGVHTFYRPRAWGDGTNAPQWGDREETQEVAKKLVEVANKP